MWRGPHWEKNARDIDPLSEALCDYLNSFPAKQRSKINHSLAPLTILIAAAFLLAEPLRTEFEQAKHEKPERTPRPEPVSPVHVERFITEEASGAPRSNGSPEGYALPDFPYADAGA